MKRTLSLILAALLLASAAVSCGKTEPSETNAPETKAPETEAVETNKGADAASTSLPIELRSPIHFKLSYTYTRVSFHSHGNIIGLISQRLKSCSNKMRS